MSTILHPPFQLNREQLAQKLRIRPNSGLEEEFEELLLQVEQVAKPKALILPVYIEQRTTDQITINGTTFTSAALVRNLAGIGRAFAYVATCGREVCELPIDPRDFVKISWLHYIKLDLLKPSLPYLKLHLKDQYGLEKLSSMNPGSADASIWPIEQQADLFAMIGDVESTIDVRLTESFLMDPDISVSGLLFPADAVYQNCQLCQREVCESRSAPFNRELWESIQTK